MFLLSELQNSALLTCGASDKWQLKGEHVDIARRGNIWGSRFVASHPLLPLKKKKPSEEPLVHPRPLEKYTASTPRPCLGGQDFRLRLEPAAGL